MPTKERLLSLDALRGFLGGIAALTPVPGFVLALGSLLACWLLLWILDRANLHLKA